MKKQKYVSPAKVRTPFAVNHSPVDSIQEPSRTEERKKDSSQNHFSPSSNAKLLLTDLVADKLLLAYLYIMPFL